MHSKFVLTTIFLQCFVAFSLAQKHGDTTAIAATKAWWKAATFGDTAYVKSHSTDQLTVTFNSGRTFDHIRFINQITKHNPNAAITAEWSQISQQTMTPETVIITNHMVEMAGKTSHVYQYMTVLVRKHSKWMVAAAQSTRVIELAPPAPLSIVGNLNDFKGKYLTPAGITLQIIVRDTSLILKEPSGEETRLEGIGPSLFEIPQILSAGNVRFSFSRDNTGKVKYMIRVAPKIITMTRMD